MDERQKIAQQMRADWDRRVAHDYRFWMSDGHKSDQAMFESGERDLAILLADLEIVPGSTFLEIGCGVGRLLNAALPRFSKVIGFDVSEKAIKKAQELLPESTALELRCSDGMSLNPIADKSIDLIVSYAALTSIPTDIMAGYFCEMNRALKDNGTVRVQMYLGTQHLVGNNDTLHLRCYDADNFRVAMASAGFHIEWIHELKLPFQVSFAELGIGAVIVSLKKNGSVAESREAISKLLLPGGEPQDWDEGKASEIESYMALTYAQDLVDQGELERARETLELVATRTSSLAIDIRDLLDRIVSTVKKKTADLSHLGSESVAHIDKTAIYEKNSLCLRQAFPLVAASIERAQVNLSAISLQNTPDGAVIICDGQGLDHGEKPLSAAAIWAKRLLAEKRFEAAERIIVYGLSAAYHVRALLAATSKQVAVIEPRLDVFITAMNSIDLSDVLPRLVALEVGPSATLSCITQDSELTVRPQTQVVSTETCARVKATFYGKRGLSTLHPKITVLGPLQGGTLPITAY